MVLLGRFPNDPEAFCDSKHLEGTREKFLDLEVLGDSRDDLGIFVVYLRHKDHWDCRAHAVLSKFFEKLFNRNHIHWKLHEDHVGVSLLVG